MLDIILEFPIKYIYIYTKNNKPKPKHNNNVIGCCNSDDSLAISLVTIAVTASSSLDPTYVKPRHNPAKHDV